MSDLVTANAPPPPLPVTWNAACWAESMLTGLCGPHGHCRQDWDVATWPPTLSPLGLWPLVS